MTPPPPRPAPRHLLADAGTTRAMSWVMAVMVFLTVLAGALGLATWRAGGAIDRQLGARVTVQLLGSDDAGVARAVAAIRAVPGVANAAAVPRDEMADLLRPWLGDAGLDADLPIPTMIDVDLTAADPAVADAVAVRVAAVARDARTERSAAWLAPVRGVVGAMGWLAAAVVLVVGGATAAIVLLAARAGLDTHRDTIGVLHMLGSTDVQIARLFQRRIAIDTLTGGLAGAAAAMAAILLLGQRLSGLQTAVTSDLALAPADWAVLAAVPLAFAGVAAGAARLAVLRALGRVL